MYLYAPSRVEEEYKLLLTRNLKMRPGFPIPPLLVTCVMLMMYKMSNTSLFTALIHTWSLSEGLMHPSFLFHYLSSDLSAFTFGLGLQALQTSAKQPSFGGHSYLT